MKKLSFFILIAVFVASCNVPEQTVIENEVERDGVFIHMTYGHENPHRVLMPLQMASMMANDKDVLIYMDIDAVKLLTKDAEDVEYMHFTPLKESLANLLEMGVTVFACPGCMKAHGIEESDLMEGIQVAQKEKFFNFTNGKIVSLTY